MYDVINIPVSVAVLQLKERVMLLCHVLNIRVQALFYVVIISSIIGICYIILSVCWHAHTEEVTIV